MRAVLSVVSFWLAITWCFAENPHPKQYNFISFSHREKIINSELDSIISPSFKSHPDYGITPFEKPCENCMELTDHRDADSRYYIEKGTKGNTFINSNPMVQ